MSKNWKKTVIVKIFILFFLASAFSPTVQGAPFMKICLTIGEASYSLEEDDYLVKIVSVSTDKCQYAHEEDVEITVNFTSHAQEALLVMIRVTVHDALNVPIGEAYVLLTIGGADFCTTKVYTEVFTIHIPNYASVGNATIHAVPRVKLDGDWVSAGPELDEVFFIMPLRAHESSRLIGDSSVGYFVK